MKNIVVLGSTGSVGCQTLEVVSAHPEEFKVMGLACYSDIELLAKQIEQFRPPWAAVVNQNRGKKLAKRLQRKKIKVFWGEDSLIKMATLPEAKTVVVSVAGAAGILPTIEAIRQKKEIALATKEVMVAAGDLINEEVKKNGVRLIPVDSEHSAIYQCLHNGARREINKIYLTCSGGAFRGKRKKELAQVTPQQALHHPNWRMGAKITVDCATLMNKGLELIEAQKLFGLTVDQVQVVIHPQSIIHSMVEFVDGNIIAQLGPADMRFPIRYALAYPRRLKNHFQFLNPLALGQLTFQPPDWETFECLSLALQAAKRGGTLPAVLNAADEEAVKLFLERKIKFLEIPVLIRKLLKSHRIIEKPSLADIFQADSWARRKVRGGMC